MQPFSESAPARQPNLASGGERRAAASRGTGDGRRHPGGTSLRRWACPCHSVGAGLLRQTHPIIKRRPTRRPPGGRSGTRALSRSRAISPLEVGDREGLGHGGASLGARAVTERFFRPGGKGFPLAVRAPGTGDGCSPHPPAKSLESRGRETLPELSTLGMRIAVWVLVPTSGSGKSRRSPATGNDGKGTW